MTANTNDEDRYYEEPLASQLEAKREQASRYPRWGKNEMPSDIAVDSLRDDQVADLNRLLKEWIYRQRTKIRLDRDKAERRQKREEEAARRKAEQPALFEF